MINVNVCQKQTMIGSSYCNIYNDKEAIGQIKNLKINWLMWSDYLSGAATSE